MEIQRHKTCHHRLLCRRLVVPARLRPRLETSLGVWRPILVLAVDTDRYPHLTNYMGVSALPTIFFIPKRAYPQERWLARLSQIRSQVGRYCSEKQRMSNERMYLLAEADPIVFYGKNNRNLLLLKELFPSYALWHVAAL